jgi:hypothetical protein
VSSADAPRVSFHGFPDERAAVAAKAYLQARANVPIWVTPCEVTPENPYHLTCLPADARGLYVRVREYLEKAQ